MYSAAEISLMQETLVTSVSCGDTKLQKLLSDNVGLIWCMVNSCNKELQFLNAQLELINLAQGFTRNMIDTSSSKSASKAQDKYDAANYRDTQAQRTAQGTSCSWSKATSFQQFQRDSEQHAKTQSDSASDTKGHSSSYLWDRSQQVNSGWAYTYDISKNKSHDENLSQSGACVDRDSASSGGTPGQPVSLDVSGVVAPTLNYAGYGSWGQSVFNFFSDWVTSTIWGGTEVRAPDSPPDWTAGNAGMAGSFIMASHTPDCGSPDNPNCEPLSSFGGSYTDSWNISVAIPFIGTVSSGWKDGQGFRQSFTCHHGQSTVDGTSWEVSHGQGETIGEGKGESKSHNEGENVHDRHRSASAYRDSESHAHASTTDTMRAHGETHNGSDSSAHGESQAGNQSTAYGTSHMEGHGTAFSHREAQSESNYWSQIFNSLADMWKRVWDEVKQMEKLLSVSSASKAGRIATPCLPCDVRYTKVQKRTVAPALGRLPSMGRAGGLAWQ